MDFSTRLEDGETITSVVSAAVTPTTSPVLLPGSTTYTATKVQVPLSGGTAGVRYLVTVTITTTLGTKIGTGFVQLQDA